MPDGQGCSENHLSVKGLPSMLATTPSSSCLWRGAHSTVTKPFFFETVERSLIERIS